MNKPLAGGLVAALLLAAGHLPHAQQKAKANVSSTRQSERSPAAAEAEAWRVLSGDPNNVQALLALGRIRAEARRLEEAEALLRRAVQLDEHSATAHATLGRILLAAHKPAEAVASLERAKRLKAADEVILDLARARLAASDAAGAIAEAQTLGHQSRPAALPLLAAAHLAAGEGAKAKALVPEAALALRAKPELAAQFAGAFLAAKDASSARRVLLAALRTRKDADLLRLLAESDAMRGDVPGARASLSQAAAIPTASAEVLAAYGDFLLKHDGPAAALPVFKKAYKAAPGDVALLRKLLIVELKADDRDAASEHAGDLLRRSDNPEDFYLAGVTSLQIGNHQAAIQFLARYVAAAPNDAKGFLAYGIALLYENQFAEGKAALERAIALDANLTEAEYNLALLARREGNLEQAKAGFEKVLMKDPAHASSHVALGAIALQAGEMERARTWLERAVELDPRNADARYQLSLVYSRAGEKEAARRELAEFRRLRSANTSAKTETRPLSPPMP